MTTRRLLATAAAVWLCAPSAPGAAQTPQLELLATYSTGLTGDNAEVISIRHTDAVTVVSNTAGSVDVLDLSIPSDPRLVIRVPVDTTTGTPNSVAVHPHHDYFLVVTGRAGAVGTVYAFSLFDGRLLDSAPVGIQPDSVVISPNGRHAVVANEAEGSGAGQHGGAGSLSVIDLTVFHARGELVVQNLELASIAGVPGVSSGRTDDLAMLSIDNQPQTIEPENIAFSPDNRFAYVTLQENNAVLRLGLHTGELRVVGLGQTTHLADLTNGGGYAPTQTLTAFREPDGIAVDKTGRFFVTADEGDTRNAAGQTGVRGGRTISVFDARTGAFIADTGRQLDDAAAAAVPSLYPDTRSNRGGTEPESVDLVDYRGRTLAAVALERANAIALVDLSDPTQPVVLHVAGLGGGIGPESAKFFRLGARLFVASGNEVTGTVSIFEVVL
jgi:DNA-binding beta-propeller fold protein YncE